jgi:folate-binding protein YgfZ
MSLCHTSLHNRAVIRISGEARADFLQNLVTQNIDHCTPGTCHMAALLTPQGKLAFDFLIYAQDEAYLLECDASIVDALVKRLTLYKLRAKVEIETTALKVFAIWDPDAACADQTGFHRDPRHQALGLRGLFDTAPEFSMPLSEAANWHDFRLQLGVPEGAADMPYGKIFPLEFGLNEMAGVDFQKGCFIGQEVTSRTHRKGQLRKKLWPLAFGAAHPAIGTPIVLQNNPERQVGEIVGGAKTRALGLIREDALAEALICDGASFERTAGLFSPAA